MYVWLPLTSSADLDKLETHISPEFEPKTVIEKLKNGISAAVKGVLIEQYYVDKDYRSTYYNFYSKKGLRYRPDCVRLHFFDDTVSYDPAKLKLTSTASSDERFTDHYFGYMVLRPTGVSTIGRTVVSPDVRKGACRLIITAKHKVHLLGRKLEVSGFPSMDQHIDISVCAHVACWSILRHYSERYSIHKEFLTHDITLMAHQFDPGGIVPSRGLEVSHAERVFQEAGTFPFYVTHNKKRPDPAFYRQLCAYVESGFPLFAAMHDRQHAIAVVGCEWKSSPPAGTGLRFAWDEVEKLSVVDDNHLPYLSIPTTGGIDYAASDIDTFIVGLPEKVFYPADAVDKLATTLWALKTTVQLPPKDNSIIRYFLTTASAYRRFVREKESEFDESLLAGVMSLPFTQFIWVIEVSTYSQWADSQVEARAIVDATANIMEDNPLWLFHNRKNAVFFSRQDVSNPETDMGELALADTGHSGFTRMDQNLRPTQTK